LRAPVTIGKAPDLTLPISDDPTVSTRHCEVGLDGAGIYLQDLGSTNGSFVNNQRVAGGSRARLSDGDIVRLGGNTQFKVRVDA
jgi:pSer/pThr/pTyr-binding forkhead associated (FHA) protein